jgi:hypothetical protein
MPQTKEQVQLEYVTGEPDIQMQRKKRMHIRKEGTSTMKEKRKGKQPIQRSRTSRKKSQ